MEKNIEMLEQRMETRYETSSKEKQLCGFFKILHLLKMTTIILVVLMAVFLEVLLTEIREITISYLSYKKKKRSQAEKSLVEVIEKLGVTKQK